MSDLMRRQGWILIVLAAWVAPVLAQDQTNKEEDPASQTPVTKLIRGRVVDEAGKPVAGITVSRSWYRRDEEPVRAAADIVKTDDHGDFRVELTFYYGRSHSLYALDADRRIGGLVVASPKSPDAPVTIKAGPLVHVHGKYTCKELAKPVGWTNSMFFSMPDNTRFSEHASKKSEFSVLLPPGRYRLQGYGQSSVVEQIRRDLTLTPDKLDLDLGEIDLAASAVAKLKGKPAPSLHPTDARGVNKNVQIADYKGKWVVLEFWGHWCGPCIARAIPEMMAINDDHQDERDKFVVLSVHAPDGKSFEELDEKLKPIIRDTWGGRMMPFPILLDADGTIRDTFGVQHWPTTLLFDPEGKLVDEVQPQEFAAKLKPVPLAIALPRQLDRDVTVNFDGTLEMALKYLSFMSHKDFELDQEALSPLGINGKTKVPLTISGRISLRSALDLLLDPLNLTYKFGPKGYVITSRSATDSRSPATLTAPQMRCAERIERTLRESKFTYDFDKTPLAKVAAFFERESSENVVLDPRGRMNGRIDPATPITGSGHDVPMGEALGRLVGPLGLRIAVRDEVIVLEATSVSSVNGSAPAAPGAKDGDKVFVGYLFGQSSNIDFRLYTHLCHAFLVADGEGHVQKGRRVPNRQLTDDAHKAGVRVILSLGGWGWDKQFASIVSKPEAEERYARSVMEIVDQFNYDGIDFDWEYPDTKEEVAGFERLTRRFRKELDELGRKKGRSMQVTMALSANPGTIRWLDKAFLLETMDWINVMTYDYTGDWTNYAGHHSPLHASSKQPGGNPRSTELTMKYLVEARGLPANRLAVGIPLYGRGFNVAEPYGSTKGAPKSRVPGGDYRNIHKLASQEGWVRKWDDETKNPWLISAKGPVVIGYDDAESVAIKTDWAMKQGFRGVFFWQIHADRLTEGTHPLQEASHKEWERAAPKSQ